MDYATSLAHELPPVEQAGSPSRFLRWRWIEGAVLVFFWTLIALLTLAQHAFDPRSGDQGGLHQGEVLQTFLQYAVWAALTPCIFWMSARFTLERRGWLRLVPLYIVVGIAVAVLADLIDHLLWNALVSGVPPRPVSVLYILSGFHFLGEFSLYFVLLIAGFTRFFFLRSQENQKEAARLQAHLAEARLQTLRMQINPHFLFNTLHVISDNFEEDPRTARRMIARLSEILRYTFEETGAREVPLGQELRFLDGYLDIQRFRFEDRLSVTKEIAPDVREALVPNMILQPLVENAIKHGVSQLEGPGCIALRAWREGETLHLVVRDNGPGLTPPGGDGARQVSGGVGLHNTRERLKGLYGPNQHFALEPAPGGGLIAHLSLPFHTGADYKVVAVEEG